MSIEKKYLLKISLSDGRKQDAGVISVPCGISPHIGENNNWWIGETDTGVCALGRADERLDKMGITVLDGKLCAEFEDRQN